MGPNGEAARTGRATKRKATHPARPRRTVEAEYLAALADAVPLSRWRRIVEATADQAEKGDAKARDWLARYLLGEEPPSLVAVAAEVAEGIPIGDRALLDGLVEARKDAEHLRMFSGFEAEAAEKLLTRLARPTGDHAGEGQTGTSGEVASLNKDADGGIATGSAAGG